MSDLTEKWKKGELKEGAYYAKMPNNKIVILDNNSWLWYRGDLYADKVTILVPVPTYEELQALKEKNERQKELIKTLGSDIDYLDTKKMVLIVEVNNLKSLLKECKEFIEEENPKDFTIMSERMDELLTKINEVLK